VIRSTLLCLSLVVGPAVTPCAPAGDFADIVVFDPATIQDHATYEHPHQLATGVDDVWVNGVRALRHGEATGAASGRAVRGRAWTGASGSGCRASARDWTWNP
jgi:N-acyl-D-amino-acid deacylase